MTGAALPSSSARLYTRLAQFLSNGTAHGGLNSTTPDVVAEGLVYKRLVIAAAHFMDLFTEMIEDLVVQPDRYSGLAGFRWYHGSSPAFAEIVFAFHELCFSYWARSCRVARRAEMILMRSLRIV